MGVQGKVANARALAMMLARNPIELRYARRWAVQLRTPTLQSRLPWLPFRIIDKLGEETGPAARVFEFGGGGSTLWFAERAAEVVTVEHDDLWFEALASAVDSQANCQLIRGSSEDGFLEYVSSINDYSDNYFDLVVVDGRERVKCCLAAIPKLKPGGLLVLDDTDRERYGTVFERLAGWQALTVNGFAPFKPLPGVTTIWRKPNES